MSLVVDKLVLDALGRRRMAETVSLAIELNGQRPVLAVHLNSGRRVLGAPLKKSDVRKAVARLARRGEIKTHPGNRLLWMVYRSETWNDVCQMCGVDP